MIDDAITQQIVNNATGAMQAQGSRMAPVGKRKTAQPDGNKGRAGAISRRLARGK